MNNIIVLSQIPKVFDCLYDIDILDSITITELRDAFRPSQIQSKIWLLDHIQNHITDASRVCVLGAWFGFIASCLGDMGVQHITEVDLDPRHEKFAKRLNHRHRHYRRITGDACEVDLKDFDMVINTSSEHMSDRWFDQVRPGTVVALQTNNIDHVSHCNTKNNLSQVCETYSMNMIYQGQKDFVSYSRFMIVGIKP